MENLHLDLHGEGQAVILSISFLFFRVNLLCLICMVKSSQSLLLVARIIFLASPYKISLLKLTASVALGVNNQSYISCNKFKPNFFHFHIHCCNQLILTTYCPGFCMLHCLLHLLDLLSLDHIFLGMQKQSRIATADENLRSLTLDLQTDFCIQQHFSLPIFFS